MLAIRAALTFALALAAAAPACADATDNLLMWVRNGEYVWSECCVICRRGPERAPSSQ